MTVRPTKAAWSAAAFKTGRTMWEGGSTLAEIAAELDKTIGAVESYFKRRGIRRPESANPWPDERVTLLRRLIAEGKSGPQTAAIMGCTRNTVGAKAKRLGLVFKGGDDRNPAVRSRENRANLRASAPVFKLEPRAVKPKGRGIPPIKSAIDTALAAQAFVPPTEHAPAELPTLAQLGSRSCRWPLGSVLRGQGYEQRFCGDARDTGENYCPCHKRLSMRAA